MRNIVLLTRQPDAHAVVRLNAAAATRADFALHSVDPHEYYLYLTGGLAHAACPRPGCAPAESVLIPRLGSLATEYALAALDMLERQGARTLNRCAGLLRLRHKFLALAELAGAGLPVPDSVMLRAPSDLEPAVARLGGYPVVLKFIRGSQGVGVVYAPDASVAGSVLEALNLVQYDVMLQRYLPAAAAGDTRVLVLAGRARWAVRRESPPGGFRSNLHRGGTPSALELTPQLAELAERCAAVFGLGLAGVDIADSDAGPVVMEVNASPGFNTMETVYGADVAGAILDAALALACGG
jgi:ribosomal protein S6--L-glutamate ligase